MQLHSDNKFSKIDLSIQKWSLQNNIQLQTQYQDYEVRSFQINDNSGKKSFQMWIKPARNNNFIIIVWDYKKRKEEIRSSSEEIEMGLDLGLKIIRKWLNEDA